MLRLKCSLPRWVYKVYHSLFQTQVHKTLQMNVSSCKITCGTIIQDTVNCWSIKLVLSVPEPESLAAFGQPVIVSKSTLQYSASRLFVWEWESLFPPLTASKSFHGPVGQLQAAATQCRVVLDDDGCSVLTFEPQLTTRHNRIVSFLVAAAAAATLVWQHGNLCLALLQKGNTRVLHRLLRWSCRAS